MIFHLSLLQDGRGIPTKHDEVLNLKKVAKEIRSPESARQGSLHINEVLSNTDSFFVVNETCSA